MILKRFTRIVVGPRDEIVVIVTGKYVLVGQGKIAVAIFKQRRGIGRVLLKLERVRSQKLLPVCA